MPGSAGVSVPLSSDRISRSIAAPWLPRPAAVGLPGPVVVEPSEAMPRLRPATWSPLESGKRVIGGLAEQPGHLQVEAGRREYLGRSTARTSRVWCSAGPSRRPSRNLVRSLPVPGWTG